MSLILEALRKSEADRKRGAAPSLSAELPPSPRAEPGLRSRREWWVAAIAMLAFALWAVHGALSPSATPLSPRLDTVRDAAPQATLPPVHRLVAQVAAEPPRDTPTTSAPGPAANASHQVPTHRDASSVVDTPIVAPTAAVESPRTAMPMSSSAPLSLSDLTFDQRKALPPLKMSMHLWNDDPAQRFVIIDGDRLHEGDRVGEAVVASIVADGVLLDWDGRLLKLPIR
jgi:general secretion pathway protein B